MFKSRRLKTVSNAIKTVSSSDVSAGVNSKLFELKEISRYGMNGQITALGYDPVQSLMAVATDSGEIHVYGRHQVEVVFTVDSKATIKNLRFLKGVYLVAVDSKDSVLVLSLLSKSFLATFFAPGKITCVESDPSMDWLILGLQSGTVVIYDIDRDAISPVRIENLQKSHFFPKEAVSPVVSIQWNPRDFGTLLISYTKVTVIYSFVENQVKSHFIYKVPPSAPGGDSTVDLESERIPRVTQSLYHPNSLNLLTVHEDNSLVFWDANNGTLIQARTLFDTDVNVPRNFNDSSAVKNTKIFKVAWLCQANPEYTSLLIAGGSSLEGTGCHNLTLMDLGGTPMYSVTSYEKMSNFYANPVKQKILPINNSASVIDFLTLARASPYFSGNHDPGFIVVLLENGELETLLFPSGHTTYKASLFPQSISWVRPCATKSVATAVPKKLWLGMMSSTYNKDYLLKGGAPVKKPLRVHETRSALATGHTNGSVRIWDASHGELDDSSVFDVNLSHVLNKATGLAVDNISFASETAELAVSVEDGDVVLFKFQTNEHFAPEGSPIVNDVEVNFRRFSLNTNNEILIDVADRAPRNVREGFMPSTAVHARKGKVSALKNSNVGFVAIAYEEGTIMVIDRRGPAVIYMGNVRNTSRGRSLCATCFEFTILGYGDDSYSSIVLFAGTDAGELLSFKVLPDQGGRFAVDPIECLQTNDSGPLLSIESFAKMDGKPCQATIAGMQQLSKGIYVQSQLVICGATDIRLATPGKSKDSHKIFKYPVATCGLSFVPVSLQSKGTTPPPQTKVRAVAPVLICLLVNGDVKILGLPELREIKSMTLGVPIHSKYIRESSVLRNGDIVARVGKSEASLVTVLKDTSSQSSQAETHATDTLYNPELRIPCRPEFNSLQWARGTLYVRRQDLDDLLGGNARKPSKYKESAIANGTLSLDPQEKVDNKHGMSASNDHRYVAPVRHGAKTGGYGTMKYVSRAVENGWDNLEGTFNDYALAANETINEALEETGSGLVKGVFRSKIGF
ncbi:LAMI_0F09054g1_1 [Lachancea mirantina]|uniref:LAMI_0F09054g1_1 n=1 Tax=Lachancea mirantina TaxID=1230905 RepID=A0A1G4K0X7_9SACH|nr:LAMI_0F09054g1_1 [Lachancea mirantina]